MSVGSALALFASLIFLVRLLPQPIRLARQGVGSGVSPMAALNAVVAAWAWVAYGLSVGLPVVWGVSILALGPGIWQAVLLRRHVTRRDLAGTGAFIAVLVVAALVGALAAALAVTVLVTAGPQLVRVLAEDDLSGLAPATWWVAIVDATAWGLYGLSVGDVALIGYWVVLFAIAVVVLVRIATTQRADGSQQLAR